MGGETYIRQTKRSTYRPMNTMNGDFLTKLKKPLASELGRNLKGQNAAHGEVMKKQLDLWYRERDIVLGKLNKGQEEVYSTLLHVHKEKKKLQREQWKKQQALCRERAGMDGAGPAIPEPELIRGDCEDLSAIQEVSAAQRVPAYMVAKREPEAMVRLTEPADERKQEDIHVSDNQHVKGTRTAKAKIPAACNQERPRDRKRDKRKSEGTISTVVVDRGDDELLTVRNSSLTDSLVKPKEVTSKVLEVQKGAPFEPLVRERSAGDQTELERTPSMVQDLPEKLEAFSSIEELVSGDGGRSQKALNEAKKPQRKKQRRCGIVKSPTRLSLPPIKEHNAPEDGRRSIDRCADSSVSSEKNPRSMETLPLARSLFSDARAVSEPLPPVKVSQVELNKRHARRKARKQRRLLDQESFTFYVKNRRGNIIPSDCPFRKREFNPPSMREKMFQEKMLKAQTDAIDVQMQKMEAFMEKIDAEERAKRRLRDQKRQLEEEERRQKDVKPKEVLGVTIQQLVAAFVKPTALPKGMDPNSFEAMHYCKYVREYSPTRKQKVVRGAKVSSWETSPG